MFVSSGIDSSRGKGYFYKTGDKWTVNVLEPDKEKILKKLNNSDRIYEAYVADYSIIKD